jgi:transcriptional regulator with XRE-family HTH domain
MMTLTPRLGLTKARQQRGITQSELARRTGVHRIQINRYENGDMTPSVDIALKIAKALRTPAEKVWALSIAPDSEAGRDAPRGDTRGSEERN